MVGTFKDYLVERIAFMQGSFTSYKSAEARYLAKREGATEDERDTNLLMATLSNSGAAKAHDMTVELQQVLSEYNKDALRIEAAAYFIMRAIESCTYPEQLRHSIYALKLFKTLYGKTTQGAAWIDSLALEVYNHPVFGGLPEDFLTSTLRND